MSLCPYCEEEGGVFLARCGHNFHDFCINMLAADEFKMKCPNCKSPITLNKPQEELMRKFNEGKTDLNRLSEDKLKLLCKTIFEEKRKNFVDILQPIFKVEDLKMFCLYEAALAGHFEAVEWIVSRTDKWDKFKLLKNSEESGNKTLMKYVLNLEFSVKVPLVEQPGLFDNILTFFGIGAGPNDTQEYLNRLFLISCAVGDVKMVEKVLERGAKIDSSNEEGENALTYAAGNNASTEVIDFLVSNGVKIYDYPHSLLNYVNFTDAHCCEIAEKIINYGVIITLDDALRYIEDAATDDQDNFECLRLFIKNGVNIEELLFAVVQHGRDLSIVKKLIDWGADTHAVDKQGRNLLHTFCSRSQPIAQAEYFFSLGLDVNAVDKMGRSALYHTLEALSLYYCNRWARYPRNIARRFQMNSTKLVEMLIERGADVDLADCDGVSPVHLLYEYEEVELLQLLVKHGADINWKNKKGRSLAHRVCDFPQKPNEKFIKAALELGLETEVVDNEGNTPLDCCRSDESRKQMIEIFSSHK